MPNFMDELKRKVRGEVRQETPSGCVYTKGNDTSIRSFDNRNKNGASVRHVSFIAKDK